MANKGEKSEVLALAQILANSKAKNTILKFRDKQYKKEGNNIAIGDSILIDAVSLNNAGNDYDKLCSLLKIEKSSVGNRYKADALLNDAGITIKSFTGSPPTLLNASRSTRLKYQITPKFGPSDMANINKMSLKERFNNILTDRDLIFKKCVDERFRKNLEKINKDLPIKLANAVIFGKKNRKTDLKGILTTSDSCIIDLLYFALNGFTATSGFPKKEEIIKYLLIMAKTKDFYIFDLEDQSDVNNVRQYITSASYFETPSTSRHAYGTIINGDEVDICLQIRLKKLDYEINKVNKNKWEKLV